jgi:hypothetical protein
MRRYAAAFLVDPTLLLHNSQLTSPTQAQLFTPMRHHLGAMWPSLELQDGRAAGSCRPLPLKQASKFAM